MIRKAQQPCYRLGPLTQRVFSQIRGAQAEGLRHHILHCPVETQ